MLLERMATLLLSRKSNRLLLCSECVSVASLGPWASGTSVLLERIAVDGKHRCACGLPEIIGCRLVSVGGLRQVVVVVVVVVVVAEVIGEDGTKVVRANTKERV